MDLRRTNQHGDGILSHTGNSTPDVADAKIRREKRHDDTRRETLIERTRESSQLLPHAFPRYLGSIHTMVLRATTRTREHSIQSADTNNHEPQPRRHRKDNTNILVEQDIPKQRESAHILPSIQLHVRKRRDIHTNLECKRDSSGGR